MPDRSRVEPVIATIDFFRGVGALALLMGIGIAALVTGDAAGLSVGVAFIAVGVLLGGRWLRRTPRR